MNIDLWDIVMSGGVLNTERIKVHNIMTYTLVFGM